MARRIALDLEAVDLPVEVVLADLEQVRDRLVAAGADIGDIQKLGSDWSLFFRDVDGMELEVCTPAE